MTPLHRDMSELGVVAWEKKNLDSTTWDHTGGGEICHTGTPRAS